MSSIQGRRVFLLAAPIIVAVSGLVGALIGANAAEQSETIVMFGVLPLPATGLAVGVFGAALAAVLLTGLFTLVALASRLDQAAVENPDRPGSE